MYTTTACQEKPDEVRALRAAVVGLDWSGRAHDLALLISRLAFIEGERLSA
jgi:hypothetical protein